MTAKRLAICIALCSMASPAFAALSKDDVKRLGESSTVLSELRGAPDNGIPEALWDKTECVVVLPSVKKAAFLVGGEYGHGVMSCRRAGGWSAPVFMHLAKGSFGAQIGAEAVDLVLLVLNRRGIDKLLQDRVTLGADVSISAGPVGRSAAAATDAQMNAEILSYSKSRGLFAGINLSGGVLKPDTEANARAYGSAADARQIADGSARVRLPAAARSFVNTLGRDVQGTSGRK